MSYIEDVIEKGDTGSKLLRQLTEPTLSNNDRIEVIDGNAFIWTEPGETAHVYAAEGAQGAHGKEHATTMVQRLESLAIRDGAKLIAVANVIDTPDSDPQRLAALAEGMNDMAANAGIAIVNGENAVLGDRVAADNIMGVGLAISREKIQHRNEFRTRGARLYMNADGIGTKEELHERAGRPEMGLYDFIAMNVDDTEKMGAVPRVVQGILEKNTSGSHVGIDRLAKRLSKSLGFFVNMEEVHVGDRLRGYRAGVPGYNLNGAVVSTIDEELARNPPKPSAGEVVIAIQGAVRSNGISALREGAAKRFAEEGREWHETLAGRLALDYLTTPSIIFQPTFRELREKGLITSSYHMSGGAFRGKFSEPIAKHGLLVHLENLFEPHPLITTFGGLLGYGAEEMYAMWPMANEGLVTTSNPGAAIEALEEKGLRAREVGQLSNGMYRVGASLTAWNGADVNYTRHK